MFHIFLWLLVVDMTSGTPLPVLIYPTEAACVRDLNALADSFAKRPDPRVKGGYCVKVEMDHKNIT
jgi:hypothetical protein